MARSGGERKTMRATVSVRVGRNLCVGDTGGAAIEALGLGCNLGVLIGSGNGNKDGGGHPQQSLGGLRRRPGEGLVQVRGSWCCPSEELEQGGC